MPLTVDAVFHEPTATLYRCPPRQKAIRGFPSALVITNCSVGAIGLSVGLLFTDAATGKLRCWGSSPTYNLRLAFSAMLVLSRSREVSPNLPTAVLTGLNSGSSRFEAIADLVGGTETLQELLQIEPPEIKQALAFAMRFGAYSVFDRAANPFAGIPRQRLWEMVAAAQQTDSRERSEPALPTFAGDFLSASVALRR